MFYRISLSLLAGMWLAAVLSATTYNCATYSVPGASRTDISGINNSGIVVGTYVAGGIYHGFVADPSSGNLQTVDFPNAQSTEMLTINNNGVSTGQYYIPGQTGWFTLDATGNLSRITVPPPYTLFQAYGINDAGGISVLVQNSSGFLSVDILNPDGTLTPVPSPPGFSAGDLLGSINNALQVLEVNRNYEVTYLADAAGNLSNIALPSATRNDGFGLNNYGMVVGYSSLSYVSRQVVGFSRDPSGAYSEVLCPGMPFSVGLFWRAVNDNGVVAGGTYIGTPIPGDPQVTLSATELIFPPTPLGQTSDPQYVTLTNTGDARLDIAGTRSTSNEFQVSGCLDPATQTASLDPGANCALTVTATPKVQGNRTGTIFIDDSAAGAPHSIAVSVTGVVPPPSCQLTSIDPGPPAQANFTMQDANYGLKSIVVLDSTNAIVNIPAFSYGTKDPVNVTATQVDSSQSSQVDFQVTNVAGGSATCGTTFGGPASRP